MQQPIDFSTRVEQILSESFDIAEGTLLQVTRLVSDSIKVPEGDYRVLLKDSDTCTLISTNEASKQTFDVLRRTLNGFNSEVHRKTITAPVGKTIAEHVSHRRLNSDELYYASTAMRAASGDRNAMRIMGDDTDQMPPEISEWYRLMCNDNIYVGSPENIRLNYLTDKYKCNHYTPPAYDGQGAFQEI